MNLGEFYSENTHVNPATGCIIWDGPMSKGTPVVNLPGVNLPVRKFVYQTLNGQQPYRAKFQAMCENPLCVKMEHIELVLPVEQEHEYPEEKVSEAVRLKAEGYRVDVIGEKLGVSGSTISKWLKVAAAQKAEAGVLNAHR